MDQIKCLALLTSVDTGSFSAAGELLGYTSSGITRMVNALEAEVGLSLLYRSPKGVTLTSEGEHLLPCFREAARINEQITQLSAELRGLAVGRLRIGSYYSVAACWLPKILQAFQADYPGIQIETVEGGNNTLLTEISERRLDCCFCSQRDYPCDWIPLRDDQLVVWLPLDHPRANDAAFPLTELDGAPFINTLPGSDTDLERLFQQEQLSPDVRFTTVDNYATYAMVAAGLGISCNNALMARNWQPTVAILPFDPPRHITLSIAVPSLNEVSPATKQFIACAKRMVLDGIVDE